ncbi:mediator of RNA polymerase II transcription subunit 21 [Trichonephila clavipes]|nr:mediator of RNA polymerase II transcription subunit 21 [Trichonephila clavipes]
MGSLVVRAPDSGPVCLGSMPVPPNTLRVHTEADRLSQLQDAVNAQAKNICNSIGVLQQCASPSIFPEFDRVGPKPPQPPEDFCQMFATLISKTAKDIDILIDSVCQVKNHFLNFKSPVLDAYILKIKKLLSNT